ncbi:hypothetical protein CROQUDRAFT_106023 [Cronartium quercuum f. sp. fusiforme G11]|uniref:Uncharacterized protein n=1 Tax=Cronartium quercuum f. sp. fusiforme G11 TaxID=708437 RepID=A0A9P6NRB2_9BASI|nr:hypothetical protein CROQUDRAFT_106023 [Cronartium quercuum f. sp. fusiforme G11]
MHLRVSNFVDPGPEITQITIFLEPWTFERPVQVLPSTYFSRSTPLVSLDQHSNLTPCPSPSTHQIALDPSHRPVTLSIPPSPSHPMLQVSRGEAPSPPTPQTKDCSAPSPGTRHTAGCSSGFCGQGVGSANTPAEGPVRVERHSTPLLMAWSWVEGPRYFEDR